MLTGWSLRKAEASCCAGSFSSVSDTRRWRGEGFVFDVSMSEIFVILVVALIVLGPRQLAEAARVLGRVYRDLQRMSGEIRQNISLETLTSPPPDKEAPTSDAGDRAHDQQSVADSIPHQGEKWGPDFYADLLESPAEEDREGRNDARESEENDDKGPGNKREATEERAS